MPKVVSQSLSKPINGPMSIAIHPLVLVTFNITLPFFYLVLIYVSLHFHLTGVAIEAVSDSSRYFVVRVVDDNGKY